MQTVPSAFNPFQPMPPRQVQQPPQGQARPGLVSLLESFSTQAEKYIRHLSAMIGADKAWRFSGSICKQDGNKSFVESKYLQVDQGSDINVVSYDLLVSLGLPLKILAEVRFQGLSMKTADHRHTLLHYWSEFEFETEGITTNVDCFVAPKLVTQSESREIEHLSSIPGIPWLYAVDAKITIRSSSIIVSNTDVGKTPRVIQGPRIVFCKDWNLLMYPTSIFTPHPAAESKSEPESSSSSEDDSLDIEELPPRTSLADLKKKEF